MCTFTVFVAFPPFYVLRDLEHQPHIKFHKNQFFSPLFAFAKAIKPTKTANRNILDKHSIPNGENNDDEMHWQKHELPRTHLTTTPQEKSRINGENNKNFVVLNLMCSAWCYADDVVVEWRKYLFKKSTIARKLSFSSITHVHYNSLPLFSVR